MTTMMRLILLSAVASLLATTLWPGAAAAQPQAASAQPVQTTQATSVAFQWPVQGGRVTQGYSRRHLAIDIGLPYDTPVFTAAAGTIRRAGWSANQVYGIRIEVAHANGYVSTYSHLSQVLVRPGQVVARGTRIGLVGSTGRSTGPHLHFELYQHGQSLNPLSILQGSVGDQQELGATSEPRATQVSLPARQETPQVRTSDDQDKTQVRQRRFKIEGLITEVGDRPIVIAGRRIQIDFRLVPGLDIKGTLVVGTFAKVKGIVLRDGTLAAEEVKAEQPKADKQSKGEGKAKKNKGRGKGRGKGKGPPAFARGAGRGPPTA